MGHGSLASSAACPLAVEPILALSNTRHETDEVFGICLRRELDKDLPAWLWFDRGIGAGARVDSLPGRLLPGSLRGSRQWASWSHSRSRDYGPSAGSTAPCCARHRVLQSVDAEASTPSSARPPRRSRPANRGRSSRSLVQVTPATPATRPCGGSRSTIRNSSAEPGSSTTGTEDSPPPKGSVDDEGRGGSRIARSTS